MLDHDGLDLVRHVVEVVDGPLQLVEDLATGEVTENVLRRSAEAARNRAVMPASWMSSTSPSMRLICSQYSLIRAAFLPIFESSGTASLTSPAQRTMASPMKSMFGSNSRISAIRYFVLYFFFFFFFIFIFITLMILTHHILIDR